VAEAAPGELRVQFELYRRLVGARLRSDWQYRTSFVLLLLAQTVTAGLDLAVIAVIFGQVDALGGWSGVVVALAVADIDWDPVRVMMVPVALASGTAIFGSIWVITSSIAFWTVETQEFANAFTYGGNQLSLYPLDVLGPWLRRLATFVVPLAFVAYFPAAYLLGKDEPLGFPAEIALLTPVVAAVLILLARAVWRSALRHYRSTGS